VARAAIEKRGFSERVAVIAADMFTDPWPTEFDVHLISNVLHDWDEPVVRDLVAKSQTALPPGGLLIVHDAHINAEKTGPLHVAEYSALLMQITEGKCYSVEEMRSYLSVRLKDPKAAIVEFRTEPQQMYQRSVAFRPMQYGWATCVWVNDKNRLGAYSGFYVWIKGSWLPMEIAAVVAAALALAFYPFPFIVVIIGVALWFMSMDLAPWIAGKEYADWETSRMVSLRFGLATILLAWAVNCLKRGGDFAFWLHLFGIITFWGAVSFTSGGTMLDKALYCAMNVGLLFFAVFLGRRVYAVFGVIGIAMYLGDLAGKVFKDSLLFPFALSLIGIAVIAAGLLYYRHQERITAWLEARVPEAAKRLRPIHMR